MRMRCVSSVFANTVDSLSKRCWFVRKGAEPRRKGGVGDVLEGREKGGAWWRESGRRKCNFG